MKLIAHKIIIAGTLLFLLNACNSKSKKDLIVNSWRLTDTSDSIPDERKKAMFQNAVMLFEKDGSFSLSGPGGYQGGSYEISDDGKLLTIIDPGGRPHENEVTILTKEKLIIKDIATGKSLTAVADK